MLALLDQLGAGGAAIEHHGDTDDAGRKILEHLTARVRARPWRPPAPGDPQTRKVPDGRASPVAVPEELVLDALLEDLQRRC